MKDKKKTIASKCLTGFFLILLVSFLSLYLSEATGYYEYEQHQNVVLTEEKIKQFEQDVKDGKNIDIENYIETKTSYANKASNFGLEFSNFFSSLVTDGLNNIFKYIGSIANE